MATMKNLQHATTPPPTGGRTGLLAGRGRVGERKCLNQTHAQRTPERQLASFTVNPEHA
ncbi:hypothetical protein [Rhodanobacter denitrificans]|uniref:hypothetical protein n=1 Tax=Rhodanobacter denitrificans TaxID=666685 RepID=UPI001F280162|nr:hypothetical protein [Rhodanobacter denitrificans]UJJ60554.1 hypothetical protein LRK55_19160 [Rhodanobacter denitrificans]